MRVKVRFLGFLARLYGSEEVTLEVPEDSTFKDLLKSLVKRKSRFKNAVLNGGDVREIVLTLINQKDIGVLNGLNTKLKDGDEIVFVPISHGG
ncbi:MoaD/ThiS family protein [Candidatus Bathyarchaeota archaeon]|nr:MoaD/ThiS family protein [Candidatus Bathyarchaeota archaeon]MBS7613623.1 MoaD/ThiS family protein [Candidatus Bathyarchaeota archaeon]MBS7617110.1 MoaD/ThiS family protein [Candidatus Bathyarchaeota archaeon]